MQLKLNLLEHLSMIECAWMDNNKILNCCGRCSYCSNLSENYVNYVLYILRPAFTYFPIFRYNCNCVTQTATCTLVTDSCLHMKARLTMCDILWLGSSDDLETNSETLSPSAVKPSAVQRHKPRTPRTGLGSSVNAGTGSRSVIQCLMCQKTFNNSSALAKHKLIHSDERKYACTLCSKAFKRQDHL